jgi:hypothetical protein
MASKQGWAVALFGAGIVVVADAISQGGHHAGGWLLALLVGIALLAAAVLLQVWAWQLRPALLVDWAFHDRDFYTWQSPVSPGINAQSGPVGTTGPTGPTGTYGIHGGTSASVGASGTPGMAGGAAAGFHSPTFLGTARVIYLTVVNTARAGRSDAQSVWARLTFRPASKPEISFNARWAGDPATQFSSLSDEARKLTIPADDDPRLLDFALRFQGDSDWFAVSDENRARSDFRPPQHALTPNTTGEFRLVASGKPYRYAWSLQDKGKSDPILSVRRLRNRTWCHPIRGDGS